MRIPYKKALGQKVKPGRPSTGKRPEKKELFKLYSKEEKSIRELLRTSTSKNRKITGLNKIK